MINSDIISKMQELCKKYSNDGPDIEIDFTIDDIFDTYYKRFKEKIEKGEIKCR